MCPRVLEENEMQFHFFQKKITLEKLVLKHCTPNMGLLLIGTLQKTNMCASAAPVCKVPRSLVCGDGLNAQDIFHCSLHDVKQQIHAQLEQT